MRVIYDLPRLLLAFLELKISIPEEFLQVAIAMTGSKRYRIDVLLFSVAAHEQASYLKMTLHGHEQ